jgi:hypothetical protein
VITLDALDAQIAALKAQLTAAVVLESTGTGDPRWPARAHPSVPRPGSSDALANSRRTGGPRRPLNLTHWLIHEVSC